MEDIIREFWDCSLRSDFSDFDWNNAFSEFEPYLTRKLSEHGLLGEDELRQSLEDIYGDLDNSELPSWAMPQTDWVWINQSMVVDWIIKGLHEQLEMAFSSAFSDLVELHDKITSTLPESLPELIQLFDECIHAQHQSGDILDDIDIESLRDDAESDWEDEQQNKIDFPTNIRELRALPENK
jgi:iron-sulfur cluster repair protein YtfE (RIC family)